MSLWSNEELQLLKDHFDSTPIERCAAYKLAFGNARTFDAIERKVRRMRLLEQATNVIASEIEHEVEEIEQELEVGNTKLTFEQIALLNEKFGKVKKVDPVVVAERRKSLSDFIEQVLDESSNLTCKEIKLPTGGTSLCILFSDTHIGKHTDSFNSEVFQERLLSVPEKIVELDLPINEVVYMLAGDMLEGENIYETQAHHIEFPVIDQIQVAVETFWKVAEKTCKLLPDVKVRFVTCPGNHGRVSKLASEKSNFDNLIYQTLKLIANAAKNDKITVEANFEPFYLFKVQDKTGMIFHHGTKHLGTPAMQSKVSGWLHTKQFDFLCHGHWHHWEVGTQFGRPVMKNGSLPGQDDLAERMGVYDPPRQGWLLVKTGQPINQMGFFEW